MKRERQYQNRNYQEQDNENQQTEQTQQTQQQIVRKVEYTRRRNELANLFESELNNEKYDDSVPRLNIMSMSKEQRLEYIQSTINPYGYPTEYFELYLREIDVRHPDGFEHLANVTRVKLFQPMADQVSLDKQRIQQNLNVNCIRSRNTDYFDLEEGIYAYETALAELYGSLGNENENTLPRFVESYESYEGYVNKYRLVLDAIRYILGDYSEFVCVAGGFALSMYIYENYGYSVNFGDVDLFIHSCNEVTANEICKLLGKITEDKVYHNDNVLYSFYCSKAPVQIDRKSVQIVKRLYRSPAEVIMGFDVDCCCILTTLTGEIFITERGAYSIRKGYNVLNFDRMSPSYEFRLAKYNKRGFGIWIPFVQHFKENTVMDKRFISKDRGSYILIRSFLFQKQKKDQVPIDDVLEDQFTLSDYSQKFFSKYENQYIQFKTLDPSEQIINTFHRIVMDDPKEWYPVKPLGTINKISISDVEMKPIKVNVNLIKYKNIVPAMNVSYKGNKNNRSEKALFTCREIISYIQQLLGNCHLWGSLVSSSLTGISGNDLTIYSPNVRNEIDQAYVNFYIAKYLKARKTALRLKYFVDNFFGKPKDFEFKNFIMNEIELMFNDTDGVGKIVFSEDNENVTEDEEVSNNETINKIQLSYFDRELSSYISFNNSNVIFLPSGRFEYIIQQILQYLQNNNNAIKSLYYMYHYRRKAYIYYLKTPSIDVKDAMKGDLIALKFLILFGSGLFRFDTKLNIDFAEEDEIDIFENPVYSNGFYYTNQYELNLIKIGITKKEVSNGEYKFYDGPAYEQMFV